ncbi:MAG: hypothetical protein ACOCP4_04505 [Candidatus Woesearchaeota archaeon]
MNQKCIVIWKKDRIYDWYVYDIVSEDNLLSRDLEKSERHKRREIKR